MGSQTAKCEFLLAKKVCNLGKGDTQELESMHNISNVSVNGKSPSLMYCSVYLRESEFRQALTFNMHIRFLDTCRCTSQEMRWDSCSAPQCFITHQTKSKKIKGSQTAINVAMKLMIY